MTRFVLVRHAKHDWIGRGIAGRMAGVSLNADGRLQAQVLAPRLQRFEPAVICSSPRERALETAEPLAERLGQPVRILPEFEEIDFGDWTGKTFQEVEAADPQGWRAWCEQRSRARPPGGESIAEAQQRALAGLRQAMDVHPDGTVLVFSHGDVIKALVAAHLRMSLDDLEQFDIGCASVTVIDAWPGGSKVHQVNMVAA